MKVRLAITVVVALGMVLAACAGDESSPTSTSPSVADSADSTTSSTPTPATAPTVAPTTTLQSDDVSACEELAGRVIETMQAVLTAIGNLSADEMNSSAEVRAAMDANEEYLLGPSFEDACENRAELEGLICEAKPSLETFGTEGDVYMENNTPPCDL